MRREQEQKDRASNLTLHLLDSAQGHAIQTWRYKDCSRVRIGRAVDNEIRLTDPKVSRLHVELVYTNGHWLLRSHGLNGTRINDTTITGSDIRLCDRVVFQLGKDGPSFQFVTLADGNSEVATINNIDSEELEFLEIDEERKREEVEILAESAAFRALQKEARRLKDRKGS